jgi:hypothetical protein
LDETDWPVSVSEQETPGAADSGKGLLERIVAIEHELLVGVNKQQWR